MKKILFLLISVMAIAFTSCKIENATVAAHVEDTAGAPVADRYIFYIDKASYIIGAVLPPTPTEMVSGLDESGWEYVVTNKAGNVTFNLPLAVAKANYYFIVFDEGSQNWVEKEVTIHRGQNEEISFVVNR